VVRIPEGGLVFSPDGKTATLEMKNVQVVDQPKWPALDSVGRPATMTFKMIWKATDERVVYDDPQKQFRVSIDFSWKSDPLWESHANFAIIGDEVNGRYYTPVK
jgi:hypothetical protein